MSKAAEMGKVSFKGGFHLMWGLVVSTVISAVGTIIVAGILTEGEYGLYSIALSVPALLANFRDWGVAAAMIKFSAQYNYENEINKVKSIFVSGLVFETLLGVVLSILSFVLSDFIGVVILQRPNIPPLLQIASFVILTGALLSSAQAAFTGLEKMELNSLALICQSVVKTIIVTSFVILGLGALGATIGYVIAFLIAGLIGLLLMWFLYRTLPRISDGSKNILGNIKMMLKYGLPLSVGAILSGFLTQFYNFILAIYASDALVGNYHVAATFVVLITFFAAPISTMLFPAFSKLDIKKEPETLHSIFRFSVKYGALLVVPVAVLVMVLSEPGIATLFGSKYAAAPLFLALMAIQYLFTAFGNLSVGNLINGQGYTTLNLKLTLLTLAIGFPLSFLLTSQYGIIGLITTTLVAGIPSLIIALSWVNSRWHLTIDWRSSLKILFCSVLTGILTYLLVIQLSFSSWIILVIGSIVFVFLFLLIIISSRAINRSDIGNLRELVGSLGPLSGALNRILNFIEKIVTAFQPEKEI